MSLQCKDCAYCWKEEDDYRPCCHFVPVGPDDHSPCEQEDIDLQRELDRREEEEEREYLTRMFEEDEDDDPGPEDILADESKTAWDKFVDLLEYEGIIGYHNVIADWIFELYGIDLTDCPEVKGEER